MIAKQLVLRWFAPAMTRAELRASFAGIAAVLVLAPLGAYGQGSALLAALARREERLADVDSYVERIAGGEIPGVRLGLPGDAQGACVSNCVVKKVETYPKADGTLGRRERTLSGLEVQSLAGLSPGADFVDIYGGALIDAQAVFNSYAGGAGLGAGLGMMMGADEPWMNPYEMFASGGFMMQETAAAMREAEQSLATSAAQVQAEANDVAAIVAQIEDLGIENLADGPARRYGADDLNQTVEAGDGQQAVLNGASVWVDLEKEAIVAHRIEGTMIADGESRPFFIEVLNSDFRDVPGCDLYEPYRRVMRMGGLLDDAQMAEMEEAKQKLAEFDQQMAAMPASQRAMMEGMIGGQMATLRSMACGAMEHVQEIEEIICNPDLAALFGNGGSVLDVGPVVDLAQIQRNLATLGYEPGNTDGVLDTLTQIAISQFEAEHGMAVTGQPSPELAAALAAAVAG